MRVECSSLSFGYKSVLKKNFELGLIPLKKDITGHKLKKEYLSVDHTIPKVRGGKSDIYNYSLMDSFINNKRGAKPLKQFIDLESLIEYINVMINVKTPDVDGVDYLKGWLKNLLKELKNA